MKNNLVKPRMLETELLEAEDLLEVVYLVLQSLEVVEVGSILFHKKILSWKENEVSGFILFSH